MTVRTPKLIKNRYLLFLKLEDVHNLQIYQNKLQFLIILTLTFKIKQIRTFG